MSLRFSSSLRNLVRTWMPDMLVFYLNYSSYETDTWFPQQLGYVSSESDRPATVEKVKAAERRRMEAYSEITESSKYPTPRIRLTPSLLRLGFFFERDCSRIESR